MKKLLLLLVAALGIGCSSVKLVSTTKGVYKVENSLSKHENYVLANELMVAKFVSAEDVIQFSDIKSGTIVAKYRVSYLGEGNFWKSDPAGSVYAILTIRATDNGAQIEIQATSSIPSWGVNSALFNMKALSLSIQSSMNNA